MIWCLSVWEKWKLKLRWEGGIVKSKKKVNCSSSNWFSNITGGGPPTMKQTDMVHICLEWEDTQNK